MNLRIWIFLKRGLSISFMLTWRSILLPSQDIDCDKTTFGSMRRCFTVFCSSPRHSSPHVCLDKGKADRKYWIILLQKRSSLALKGHSKFVNAGEHRNSDKSDWFNGSPPQITCRLNAKKNSIEKIGTNNASKAKSTHFLSEPNDDSEDAFDSLSLNFCL